MSAGVANATLRLATLGSRFLLVLVLARLLDTAELGVYGLFSASLSLGMFFLGFEFHVFSARELLRLPESERPALIRDQFVLHGIAYVVGAPLFLLFFVSGALPWKHAPWLYVLVVLEHALQEIFRFLVVLSRPLQASTVSFLRSGAWVYGVIGVMAIRPDLRRLDVVWAGWLGGVVMALFAGWRCMRHLAWNEVRGRPIDFRRLHRGLSISCRFLIASLSDRGMYFFDRYLLQCFWGNEAVGVYTFFTNITSAIQTALEAGVTQIFLPKLIASGAQGSSTTEVRTTLRQFGAAMAKTLFALVVTAAAGIFVVLPWTSKLVYRHELATYWVLLAAATVLGLGQIPHFALYSLGDDRPIIRSVVVGFLVAAAANLLLIPENGAVGAALSLLVGVSVVGVLKAIALRRQFR